MAKIFEQLRLPLELPKQPGKLWKSINEYHYGSDVSHVEDFLNSFKKKLSERGLTPEDLTDERLAKELGEHAYSVGAYTLGPRHVSSAMYNHQLPHDSKKNLANVWHDGMTEANTKDNSARAAKSTPPLPATDPTQLNMPFGGGSPYFRYSAPIRSQPGKHETQLGTLSGGSADYTLSMQSKPEYYIEELKTKEDTGFGKYADNPRALKEILSALYSEHLTGPHANKESFDISTWPVHETTQRMMQTGKDRTATRTLSKAGSFKEFMRNFSRDAKQVANPQTAGMLAGGLLTARNPVANLAWDLGTSAMYANAEGDMSPARIGVNFANADAIEQNPVLSSLFGGAVGAMQKAGLGDFRGSAARAAKGLKDAAKNAYDSPISAIFAALGAAPVAHGAGNVDNISKTNRAIWPAWAKVDEPKIGTTYHGTSAKSARDIIEDKFRVGGKDGRGNFNGFSLQGPGIYTTTSPADAHSWARQADYEIPVVLKTKFDNSKVIPVEDLDRKIFDEIGGDPIFKILSYGEGRKQARTRGYTGVSYPNNVSSFGGRHVVFDADADVSFSPRTLINRATTHPKAERVMELITDMEKKFGPSKLLDDAKLIINRASYEGREAPEVGTTRDRAMEIIMNARPGSRRQPQMSAAERFLRMLGAE